jgi:hypothetical protein
MHFYSTVSYRQLLIVGFNSSSTADPSIARKSHICSTATRPVLYPPTCLPINHLNATTYHYMRLLILIQQSTMQLHFRFTSIINYKKRILNNISLLQPISNLSTLLSIIILFAASKFVVGSTDSNVDTNMATTVNFDPSNLYPNNDLIVVCCASSRFPSCQNGMVPDDNTQPF